MRETRSVSASGAARQARSAPLRDRGRASECSVGMTGVGAASYHGNFNPVPDRELPAAMLGQLDDLIGMIRG
jgi:hypothetical protein